MTLPSPERLNELCAGTLPALLGIAVTRVTATEIHAELAITPSHLAPNGYLHAGSVVTLADTTCGNGCIAQLPEGASGFTTIEIKTNYLGTAKEGEEVVGEARLVHGGRMTQVWDAEAVNATTGKTIAVFRCTQMILWPR